MAGDPQPLEEIFAIVGEDGRPTPYFIRWAQQRQIDIEEAVTAEQALDILTAYLAEHTLQEGSGIQITPSGNLSDNPTITADVQEILDQITATRGSILYRGALGWTSLDPSTAGWFLKTNGAGADPEWAAGGSGGTVDWGAIGGTLSDQTDLQDALDEKLSVVDDTIDWGPGAVAVSPAPVFSIGYAQVEGAIAMLPAPDPLDIPIIYLAGFGFNGVAWVGAKTVHNRAYLGNDGFITGWEFTTTPYVVDDPIFHAGNLSFGTGLDYSGGVLTATGGGGSSILPVVDGSVPPNLVYLDDGSLVYAEIP